MFRKFFLVSLAASMLVMAAGCGGPKESGILKIGLEDTYPPMEFVDEETGKETIGFDIDFAKALASELGMEAQFVSTSFDGIFTALDAEKFDCIISSVSETPERHENYNLSTPYIANKIVIVTKNDNNTISSPADFAGKSVCAQTGTSSEDFCNDLRQNGTSFKYTAYDSVMQAFEELKIGRVDAVVVDIVVAMYYIAKNDQEFKVVWESDESEPLVVVSKKADTELHRKINTAIDTLKGNGKMAQIADKWFGEDITAK